jgi:hypothetical protein
MELAKASEGLGRTP